MIVRAQQEEQVACQQRSVVTIDAEQSPNGEGADYIIISHNIRTHLGEEGG
jgi:hypothetical protein